MTSSDYISIRGQQLPLSKLVNERLFEQTYVQSLRERMLSAKPFPHLVMDDLFNPDLLDLVVKEFDMLDESAWRTVKGEQELTRRSLVGARLGPAQELYFSIVNSGWFVDLLSQASGVDDLIADTKLYNGGLHETREGGSFEIHRDFNRHVRWGLQNEMVFITYLNKSWKPEWHGALELWDAASKQCAAKVEPEFGRSILMRHGPLSFHGHPDPLSPPKGVTRRSIASYYYSSDESEELLNGRFSSQFLQPPHGIHRVKRFVKQFTPPIVWDGIRRLAGK